LSNIRNSEVLPVTPDLETDHGKIGSEVAGVIKPFNKRGIFILTILLVLALVGFFTIVIPFYTLLNTAGEGAGTAAGKVAGVAIGSAEGIAQAKEAYEEGKEEGLSAKDTRAEVETKLQTTSNLEVLVYKGCEVNSNDEEDYTGLFSYNITAIFSVDMTGIEVKESEGGLLIEVPDPTCEVTVNETEVDEIITWQKHFWSGETAAAYEGYQNSMDEIKVKAAEDMEEKYMEQAQITARKMISQIANSASGGKYSNIEVTFKGEGE
jgi:hypothetical protein